TSGVLGCSRSASKPRGEPRRPSIVAPPNPPEDRPRPRDGTRRARRPTRTTALAERRILSLRASQLSWGFGALGAPWAEIPHAASAGPLRPSRSGTRKPPQGPRTRRAGRETRRAGRETRRAGHETRRAGRETRRAGHGPRFPPRKRREFRGN